MISSTDTEQTVENEEEKPQEKEYQLDRYKLLGNSKENTNSSFSSISYKTVIDKIYNHETMIQLDSVNIDYYKKLAFENNIFVELLVKSTSISDDNKTLTIEYRYDSKEEHDSKLKEAEQMIKDVLFDATANEANDFEKVLYVYKYWSENLNYDNDAANQGRTLSMEDVLYKHKAVSSNYTKMINYSLTQMGIESYAIIGDTIFGDSHEWNLVKLYDKFYELDATYESTTTQGKGLLYFGRTKEDMESDGRIYTEWVDGFEYEQYLEKESNNLEVLKNAASYKIENHVLLLLDVEQKEFAKLNTQNMEKI